MSKFKSGALEANKLQNNSKRIENVLKLFPKSERRITQYNARFGNYNQRYRRLLRVCLIRPLRLTKGRLA